MYRSHQKTVQGNHLTVVEKFSSNNKKNKIKTSIISTMFIIHFMVHDIAIIDMGHGELKMVKKPAAVLFSSNDECFRFIGTTAKRK